MNLEGYKIGWGITGSHCTFEETFTQVKKLKESGAELYHVVSYAVNETDTRFGKAEEIKEKLRHHSGNKLINSIVEAEPVGPSKLFDIYIIAPCTGNTLAKLSNGIVDTPVLMAAKAHLRNLKPLILAIATNDGLGANARNIAALLITKNIFLVPFGQDDPFNKPNSLVSKMDLLMPTVLQALEGKQLQPLLLKDNK